MKTAAEAQSHIIAKAAEDEAFRVRLLSDPKGRDRGELKIAMRSGAADDERGPVGRRGTVFATSGSTSVGHGWLMTMTILFRRPRISCFFPYCRFAVDGSRWSSPSPSGEAEGRRA